MVVFEVTCQLADGTRDSVVPGSVRLPRPADASFTSLRRAPRRPAEALVTAGPYCEYSYFEKVRCRKIFQGSEFRRCL